MNVNLALSPRLEEYLSKGGNSRLDEYVRSFLIAEVAQFRSGGDVTIWVLPELLEHVRFLSDDPTGASVRSIEEIAEFMNTQVLTGGLDPPFRLR